MQQTTQISTEVLRVHPRNQEFFDDIEGKAYEQFKESIARNGYVHTPLIVTPDMTVVSGHQRLKACRELGIDKVDVIIRNDLNTEDEKLKVLLETNFMRQKNDQAKQVKVAAEYVGLVGNKHGGNRASGKTCRLTQFEIAQSLGISERALRELLEIDRKLIPQIRELFDNGKITKYTANKVWCRLSPEDQERFFNEIGRDKIAQMTQTQTQQYIEQLRKAEMDKQRLQSELQREKCKPARIEYKDRVIDNTDYNAVEKAKKLEHLKNDLETKNKNLENSLKMTQQLLDNYKVDSEEYRKIKLQMAKLQVEKDDASSKTVAVLKLTELANDVEIFLYNKLAPTKYKDFMMVLNYDEIVKENFIHTIELVGDWYREMKTCVSENSYENIIIVEEN